MSGTVLVAYDFSEIGDRALAWAKEHARAHKVPITLLHAVLITPTPVAPDGIVAPMSPSVGDLSDTKRRLRDVAAQANVDAASEVVVSANVGDTIVQRARDLDASLIVTGTHARGPIARAFVGSVADHVIRHAHCPVVTLR